MSEAMPPQPTNPVPPKMTRDEHYNLVVDASRRVFTDFTPEAKQKVRLVWDKSSETYIEVPVVPRMKAPSLDRDLFPGTADERRAVASLGKRISRGQDIRSDDMYIMRAVWGDDIGTDAFNERIQNAPTLFEKRRLKKAAKKFGKFAAKAAKLEGPPREVDLVFHPSPETPREYTPEQKTAIEQIVELHTRPAPRGKRPTEEPEKDSREERNNTTASRPEPEQWVVDNILKARALGVFNDSDAQTLVQRLRNSDQKLLDEADLGGKKSLTDEQNEEKKQLLKRSRFNVAMDYMDSHGIYDDTNNQEITWALAQAIAAMRRLDQLGIDLSEIT